MAAVIGHDLHFDMARLEEIPFEIDAFVAERRFGFGLGGLEGAGQVLGFVDDAHAASAAAGGGLDDDGEADLSVRPATLLLRF